MYASAISSGMTFADGTPESTVTLAMAKKLKDKLLAEGYDVVMIREEEDVQLDNVARTVIANNTADIHISLHWDSTTSDKGLLFHECPGSQVIPGHGAGGLPLAVPQRPGGKSGKGA